MGVALALGDPLVVIGPRCRLAQSGSGVLVSGRAAEQKLWSGFPHHRPCALSGWRLGRLLISDAYTTLFSHFIPCGVSDPR